MAFLFFAILIYVKCFDFWKLRLVDYNKTMNHFLIRGAFPGGEIKEKLIHIEYEQWKVFMKLLIAEETKIDVDDFYIVDISFLHGYGDDLKRIEAEKKYFDEHPSHGEFLHWEINGTHLNATNLSPEERDQHFSDMETWDVDKVPTRMETVNSWVHSKFKEKTGPVVIYWHCEGGVDRTGEMSGSYLMKYKNWNFKKVYDYDTKVKEGRLIGTGNAYMMNWYCYYLEKYEGKTGLDCGTW